MWRKLWKKLKSDTPFLGCGGGHAEKEGLKLRVKVEVVEPAGGLQQGQLCED